MKSLVLPNGKLIVYCTDSVWLIGSSCAKAACAVHKTAITTILRVCLINSLLLLVEIRRLQERLIYTARDPGVYAFCTSFKQSIEDGVPDNREVVRGSNPFGPGHLNE